MIRRSWSRWLGVVRLGIVAGCLLAWTAPVAVKAAPVPSRTEAEEASASADPQDPVAGGESDTEVQVFGVILLLFVLLMYLWRSRD